MTKTFVVKNGFIHWYHNKVLGGVRKDTPEHRKMLKDAGYEERDSYERR